MVRQHRRPVNKENFVIKGFCPETYQQSFTHHTHFPLQCTAEFYILLIVLYIAVISILLLLLLLCYERFQYFNDTVNTSWRIARHTEVFIIREQCSSRCTHHSPQRLRPANTRILLIIESMDRELNHPR